LPQTQGCGISGWLVKDRRAGDNALGHLAGQNARTDIRHARRALTVAELLAVLDAALASPKTIRSLTGTDRYYLYLTAMSTGYRVSELANMTPSAFDLAGERPSATVAAAYTKNKRPATQPLPIDVAEALAAYLTGKPSGSLVWPGTWTEKAAKMLRVDLAAASIPYVTQGPDGPEYADFHALRHSYITNVVASGVNVKLAQTLAGHSSVALTLGRYSHVQLYDQAAAVETLPRLLPDRPDQQSLRATGTEGACTKLAQAAEAGRQDVTRSGPQQALLQVRCGQGI
jgi:integrase